MIFLALFSLFLPLRARAEETEPSAPVAALHPVEAARSAAYFCFDDPRSVYADATGITVADGDTVKVIDGAEVSTAIETDADKALRRGDRLITLENGVIFMHYYGNDEQAAGDCSLELDLPVTDFDILGTALYAISDGKLVTVELGETSFMGAPTVRDIVSPEHASVKATAVSVGVFAGKPVCYVAVDSQMFSGGKQDVCVVEDGKASAVLRQADRITALAADADGMLYALTAARITRYEYSGGGLIERDSVVPSSPMLCIDAAGGAVYAFDSCYALHKLSADLSADTVLFASASSSDGFFYLPTGAAVKNNTLYVSDAVNGRVVVFDGKLSYLDGEFTFPVSVASDCFGAVYVAYDYNKVGIITDTERHVISVDGVISQIAVDADENLYILASDGLWLFADGKSTKLTDTVYKAITLSVGRERLYALSDAVYLLQIDGKELSKTKLCDAPADAISLAVDLDDNAFILTRNSVVAAKPESGKTVSYPLMLDQAEYSLGFTRGQIVLSTVSNGFIEYGDAVIVDSYKHRVFTVDGDALGIKLVGEDYGDKHAHVIDDSLRAYSEDERIIRKTLRDATVFDRPMGASVGYTVAAGRNVIVPLYSLDDAREYAMILVDDIVTGELVCGYVYKGALSDPLPYSAPPAEQCTVYSNATPVYKFPSRGAKKLTDGYSSVVRNTVFDMRPFVESYRDAYDNLWYRVTVDGTHDGYILAANLSLNGYEPNFIRPAYNAKIVEYGGERTAKTYTRVGDEYVPLDAVLAAGTRVEVIGTFDSSLPYTQIKYLDAEFGTLTCYVETSHIEYEGVNIVLIVAVIVILITVVLAAIIIIRQVRIKQRSPE